MSISALVNSTGEVIELPADTPEQAVESLLLVNEMLDAYDSVKAGLKKILGDHVDANGPLEHNGWAVRTFTTQRQNYDKAVMRQVFDEDTLDLFLEPAKGKVDRYIKDHLEELGDGSTRLRESMIPAGKAYSVVRLERIERDK